MSLRISLKPFRISWKNKETETIFFKVIDKGPIINKKYFNNLHCFGDEVLNNAPKGMLYIGSYKNKYLEVVFNKKFTTIPKIKEFLKKYKIKFKLIKNKSK